LSPEIPVDANQAIFEMSNMYLHRLFYKMLLSAQTFFSGYSTVLNSEFPTIIENVSVLVLDKYGCPGLWSDCGRYYPWLWSI